MRTPTATRHASEDSISREVHLRKGNLLKINYNRKEKSLEELSKRFLMLFIDKDESSISLEIIT